MLVLFAFGFVLFLHSAISGSNWRGDKHFGKQLPVTTIGIQQNVRLDNQYIKRLVSCKNHIPENERVLCSYEGWGCIELIGYQPIVYDFDFVGRNVLDRVQQVVDEVIEEDGHLWAYATTKESDFVEKMKLVQGYKMTMDVDNENVYVYFSR